MTRTRDAAREKIGRVSIIFPCPVVAGRLFRLFPQQGCGPSYNERRLHMTLEAAQRAAQRLRRASRARCLARFVFSIGPTALLNGPLRHDSRAPLLAIVTPWCRTVAVIPTILQAPNQGGTPFGHPSQFLVLEVFPLTLKPLDYVVAILLFLCY